MAMIHLFQAQEGRLGCGAIGARQLVIPPMLLLTLWGAVANLAAFGAEPEGDDGLHFFADRMRDDGLFAFRFHTISALLHLQVIKHWGILFIGRVQPLRDEFLGVAGFYLIVGRQTGAGKIRIFEFYTLQFHVAQKRFGHVVDQEQTPRRATYFVVRECDFSLEVVTDFHEIEGIDVAVGNLHARVFLEFSQADRRRNAAALERNVGFGAFLG